MYGTASAVADGGTVAFQDSYYGDDFVGKIQTALPGATSLFHSRIDS